MERGIRKILAFVKPKIASNTNTEALGNFEKIQVALGRPNRCKFYSAA